MDFLSYSYLQSGQQAKAREVIEHPDHVVGANEESKAEHRAYFTARTAMELHRWKEAAALPIPATRKDWLDTVYWARAVGASRSGDIAGAEADVKELTQLVADREKRARKEGYGGSNEKATDLREAESWLSFAKGKSDEALTELRAAADHQDKNGGESVGLPAREMLPDMLLWLSRRSPRTRRSENLSRAEMSGHSCVPLLVIEPAPLRLPCLTQQPFRPKLRLSKHMHARQD